MLASRNLDEARAAVETIIAKCPSASLEVVQIDLGSSESVARAAEEVVAQHPHVDILVNNAGLMAMPEVRTVDGFETQFGVDHLDHWALTARLMLAPRRPVCFGSAPSLQRVGACSDSKLANHHFAIVLRQHFERLGSRATSLLAHPGTSNANLQVQTVEEGGGGIIGDLSLTFVRWLGVPPVRGALSQIRAAADPRANAGRERPESSTPTADRRHPVRVRPRRDPRVTRTPLPRSWASVERRSGVPPG